MSHRCVFFLERLQNGDITAAEKIIPHNVTFSCDARCITSFLSTQTFTLIVLGYKCNSGALWSGKNSLQYLLEEHEKSLKIQALQIIIRERALVQNFELSL